MNGELAQLIALVAHTRVGLSGDPFSLDLTNSTFRYVRRLSFEVQRRRLFRDATFESVARTPREWYDGLVRARCRTVLLVISWPPGDLPGHVASAFAGGGHWGAVVSDEDRHTLWRAYWAVGDGKAAVENKIWEVRYRGFPFRLSAPGDAIPEASSRLGEVLQAADNLARDAQLYSWRSWFQSARDKLTAESVRFEYHPDMLPSGYSQAARKLLSAAERGWVFGGIGSWNDLGFEQRELQERYDALTPVLYEAILKAVVAAVNDGV